MLAVFQPMFDYCISGDDEYDEAKMHCTWTHVKSEHKSNSKNLCWIHDVGYVMFLQPPKINISLNLKQNCIGFPPTGLCRILDCNVSMAHIVCSRHLIIHESISLGRVFEWQYWFLCLKVSAIIGVRIGLTVVDFLPFWSWWMVKITRSTPSINQTLLIYACRLRLTGCFGSQCLL